MNCYGFKVNALHYNHISRVQALWNGSHCAACSTQAQLAIFFLRYLQTSPWVLAKVVTAGNSVAMSSLR